MRFGVNSAFARLGGFSPPRWISFIARSQGINFGPLCIVRATVGPTSRYLRGLSWKMCPLDGLHTKLSVTDGLGVTGSVMV
jgi:hypothetical protein